MGGSGAEDKARGLTVSAVEQPGVAGGRAVSSGLMRGIDGVSDERNATGIRP
jgi:hypothetical protein